MPVLSIIVPVYNTEAYLERCINSILQQTFRDFELILVNDGSTDNSLEIIKHFALQDSRIVVIDTVNQGVSNARNLGLKAAKGVYIGFVDSDDFIAPDMYKVLIDLIQETKAEIACCQTEELNIKMTVQKVRLPQIMDNEEFLIHIFDRPATVHSSTWNKLFIKDRISKFFDTTLIMDEDTLFLIHYVMNIRRASLTNYVGYYYNRNTNSVTMRDARNIVRGLAARGKIVEELSNFSDNVFSVAEATHLDRCCYGFSTSLIDRKSEYYKIAKEELLSYVKKHFWHILKNNLISWKLKIVVGYRVMQSLLIF